METCNRLYLLDYYTTTVTVEGNDSYGALRRPIFIVCEIYCHIVNTENIDGMIWWKLKHFLNIDNIYLSSFVMANFFFNPKLLIFKQ